MKPRVVPAPERARMLALARGLETRDADVIAAVDPATGRALSDHEAIAVTLWPRLR